MCKSVYYYNRDVTRPKAIMNEDISPRAPTIADVARRAGVSKSAVSKVLRNAYGLSDDMRERVDAAIREMEYRPRLAARTMRGSSKTIGVQLPEVGNEFISLILEAAFAEFERSTFQPIIAPFQGSSRITHALTSLVDRQVDGILAISPFTDADYLERLSRRVPLVTIGRHDHAVGYDTVVGDDVGGARAVMDHLIGLGHTRIAHLTLAEQFIDHAENDGHALRLATYQRAMESIGSPPCVIRCDGSEAQAADATRRLLSSPHPHTALFAAHDTLALGALRAVAEAGLDEHRFSVVGYDDIPMASHPLIGLTSVDQQGAELGRAAALLLLERIAGRTEPKTLQTIPRLNARRSSHRVEIDRNTIPASNA